MTTLKILFTVLFLSIFLINPYTSRAENTSASKTAELNSQIIEEIKEVLQTPYLKFSDKNLTGNIKVITTVNREGKIIFNKIEGLNENLVSNVIAKLNSLNLWTSPDYDAKTFTYSINYKN